MSPWPTFTCTYHFDGKPNTVHIEERDEEEARERLKCVPLARIDGELVVDGMLPGGGLLVRFLRWLKGGGA